MFNINLNNDALSDYLLFARWDSLSPAEKTLAIEKVSYKVNMLFDCGPVQIDDADYYEYVISPLLASSIDSGNHGEWWRRVKNSEIYNREERVVAFKECLKEIRKKGHSIDTQ